MSDSKEEKYQERGDEVLKRMLKTPPAPKGEKRYVAPDGSKDSEGEPAGC